MQNGAGPLKPIGFWSYTSSDDTSSRGRLSQLRRLLADELQLRLGRSQKVHVFQDVAAIPLGSDWEQEINKALAESSFLIPIVTPAFLESEWCCKEVARFREHEAAAGRDDLIFPFHYISVDDLHPHEVHDATVLELLRKRQRIRFDDLRFKDPTGEEVALRLAALADAVRSALRRGVPPAVLARADKADPPAAAVPTDAATPRPVPPPVLVAPPVVKNVRDEIEPDMVLIEPGSFVMGVPDEEEAREKVPQSWRGKSSPRHTVRLSGFYLGRYPVTRGEFARFIAESGHDIPKGAYGYVAGKGWEQSDAFGWHNPGFPQDDRHPVVCVSHDDAGAYARWLSERTGRDYRLPSEAEWEYAARAGTATARFWGDDRDGARRHANVADRSLMRDMKMKFDPQRFFDWDDGFPFTSPVGSFGPNAFGLHDMLGNVWEWTADHWHENYKGAPDDGAAWTTTGSESDGGLRVLRGGSWNDSPWNVRAGTRNGDLSGDRDDDAGFRLARTL